MAIRGFTFLTLCIFWGWAAAKPAEQESFAYRAYYQGLLSAMAPVTIADIRLDVQQAGNEPLLITTLSLTSEAHALMDTFYPIRYWLRSIYAEQAQMLLGYETYKRTSKVKHDLTLVDTLQGRVSVLVPGEGDAAGLPVEVKPWLSPLHFVEKPGVEPLSVPAGVLDRLSLLQHLRLHLPDNGQQLRLKVTNGQKLFDYRVTNEGLEQVSVGKDIRDSWRVRVEGFKQRSGDELEADHEPVYVWFTADEQRIPVRFHSNAALGGFTVEWVSEAMDFTVEMSDQPLPVVPTEAFDEG